MEVTKNCSGETVPEQHCERLEDIKQLACSEDLEDDGDAKPPHMKSNVPASIDKENRFLFFYMNTAEKTRLSIGHQLSDMVASCTFKGKDCPSG